MSPSSVPERPHCIVVSIPLDRSVCAAVPRHVHARVHASAHGSTVLWETDRAPGFPDGPDRWSLVLSVPVSVQAALARNAVRFVSVDWDSGSGTWSHRVPFSTAALSSTLVLRALHLRLATLEAAWARTAVAGALGELRDVADEHERRLRAMESPSAIAALAQQTADIERRLDRIDGAGGLVVRIEDELEDLVGPDGDVVDFEERLSRLEHRFMQNPLGRSTEQDPHAR